MAEEARLAEEARIQAELEAGAAEKEAYWDSQELPGDEAKIVPDLPTDATALDAEDGGRASKLKLLVAVVVILAGAGAAFTFL